MKKPTFVVLDDYDGPGAITTKVTLDNMYDDDAEFVYFEHSDDPAADFGLNRKEARQLRNFLNKCLEW